MQLKWTVRAYLKYFHDFKAVMVTTLSLAINFSEYDRGEASGQANLIGRVKYVLHFSLSYASMIQLLPYFRRSHPDVGQKHYPELFKQIFPQGLPTPTTMF